MKSADLIPRNALAWIIAAQLLLLLPHVLRLPLWIVLLYGAAFFWRLQIYRGRSAVPNRWLKLLFIGASMAGIAASYGSVIGLEPTVALLLVAFALKLLESVARKDGYVVIFLGFFICITEFLFSQDLLIVIYSAVVVWVLTTALIALHRSAAIDDTGPMRLAAVMLLQAVPLMLVLFFLFPRIGPLWNVPIKTQAAKTGVSDMLRPGDISSLAQSSDVAFRASFAREVPPVSSLYWRGLVMSRIDEGAWRTVSYFETPPAERRAPPVEKTGESLDYSVIIEPTQQQWLYGLRYAEARQGGILQLPDYRLLNPVVLEQEFRYRVRSWPEAALGRDISPWRRRLETQLPEGSNPRTRALAESLYRDTGNDAEYVQRVLALFRQQPFRYTLQPPLLDNNSMDQFLLETRAGFCEHYAYAFAVLMRAVGVPARVVSGYQGGEINPVNGTVIVHQFDAHAWNEVWLEDRGWVRVDPTAAVSPARIEFGLENAMREEGSFLSSSLLSPLRYRGISWINALRLRYDAVTYQWQSWVVGFDGQQQIDVLRGVFGEINARLFVGVMLASFGSMLGLVAASLFLRNRQGRHRDPALRHIRLLQTRLRRIGFDLRPGESPGAMGRRAAERFPGASDDLRAIARLADAALYRPLGSEQRGKMQRSLRRQVRRLRLHPGR
ncbi:transglutaminase TgpA family protein [Chromatocurvus halotolerans]|uniref:Uncharacterized protein DUF4129 n=1 Tax=Chromatocurvus halotolerans TaxID=1132028 RepID=A0A4R2KPP3_9GAMM|nr:DUF3488 and transglutaminase-like domain-containing protein [Chromatocurvus halotolerans]TCO75683.1 uncharacterized protein DUF4129 [Chromatocurvus halotolerans]